MHLVAIDELRLPDYFPSLVSPLACMFDAPARSTIPGTLPTLVLPSIIFRNVHIGFTMRAVHHLNTAKLYPPLDCLSDYLPQ